MMCTAIYATLFPFRCLVFFQIKRFQNTVGPSMINKSLPHVEFIVKKVDSLTKGSERDKLLRILQWKDALHKSVDLMPEVMLNN